MAHYEALPHVAEVSTSEGTNDFELAGAVDDSRAFSDVLANGDTVAVSAYLVTGGGLEWEDGIYTYNSGTGKLERTTVLESSNADAKVSFSAGTKTLVSTPLAKRYRQMVSAGYAQSLTEAEKLQARENIGVALDSRSNRIVNGGMEIGQQNGTSSGTSTAYYGADQWSTNFVTSAGTITTQRVLSASPASSRYRYRVTITTADASLAAGEFLAITQNLAGVNVSDFLYGEASAKDAVLRFGFKGPAGTYAVAVRNSDANRTFIAEFTISGGEANTDTVQEIAITGDTTGTWLIGDGVIGLTLDIVLAAGSTFQGSAGWNAGLYRGTSSTSNGMATINDVFELFDVGLKIDPDATGEYGLYEHPTADLEIQRCRDFFVYVNGATSSTADERILVRAPTTITGGIGYGWISFGRKMSRAPVITLNNATVTNGSGAAAQDASRWGFNIRFDPSTGSASVIFGYTANARLA